MLALVKPMAVRFDPTIRLSTTWSLALKIGPVVAAFLLAESEVLLHIQLPFEFQVIR